MSAQTLAHDEPRPPVRRSALLQLGWLHFWALTGILGGMLALVALVFLIASRVWR
jgi:hypothetical protein